MIETFLSVVVPVGKRERREEVAFFLAEIVQHLAAKYTDFEIIIVDNGSEIDFRSLGKDEATRRDCYIVKLAREVSWDNAVLAGFERANGDYVASFEAAMAGQLRMLDDMYREAVGGADIVTLKDKQQRPHSWDSLAKRLFYYIYRKSGGSQLHARDRREALVNRRALNWIVRYKNADWHLTNALFSAGFNIKSLKVDLPMRQSPRIDYFTTDQAWAMLIRDSKALDLFGRTFVVAMLICLLAAVFNALLVRLLGHDILWQAQSAATGWTYLVVLIAGGILGLALLLFLSIRIQLTILEELKPHPNYSVESFCRI